MVILNVNLALSVASAGGVQKMMTAEEIIKKLDLKPLPEEGGYYRETFRAEKVNAPASIFGINSAGTRTASTAIYYLVTPESFSALHKVASDEIFHFYSGDPVEMIQIDEAGNLTHYVMGSDIFNGHSPQVVVRKGVWQGLRLKKGGGWALMGTTVSPGFEFEDFELGERDELIKIFPQHRENINSYTRGENR